MNSLSDYVLIQLIHRCSLAERLSRTLKRRSEIRWYIAIYKTNESNSAEMKSFINRYKCIKHIDIVISPLLSLFLLSDTTMSSVVRVRINCVAADSSDLAVICDDIAERCKAIESITLDIENWRGSQDIQECTDHFSRFSPSVDCRVDTQSGVLLFPMTWHNDVQKHDILPPTHSARELQASCVPEVVVNSGTIEKVVVESDLRPSTVVKLESCPRLTTLHIGHNTLNDTFPKTLTALALYRTDLTELKKIRSLQLRRLHINRLHTDDTHLSHDVFPSSLIELSISLGPSIDFSDHAGTSCQPRMNLKLLWIPSQAVTDSKLIPHSVTDLVAGSIVSGALIHLKQLKRLGYSILPEQEVTWPDTLTDLSLLISEVDGGQFCSIRSLPKNLKKLLVIRMGSAIELPPSWTLGQLTEVYLVRIKLTDTQLKSLRCNSITSNNTSEDLKIVTRGAQRLIRAIST